MNSTTCPAAWAEFTRVTKARKKWPVGLAPELKSDKLGLFQIWLGMGKDVEKVQEIVLKKRVEKGTLNEWTWEYRKKRERADKGTSHRPP